MNIRSLIKYQLPRIRNQLGRRLALPSGTYRVRGYLANRFAIDMEHEPHLAAPLERALRARPGLFVDVGVNTGQTLLRVLSIDPARRYLGFEPQVGCCFFVNQFIRDNNLSAARILPIGLADTDGILELTAHSDYDVMASLEPAGDRIGVRTSLVPVRTGDDVLREIDERAPAVVKIDVEGAELRVMRGLRETLAKARPILFFEVLPNFYGEARDPIAPAAATQNRENAVAIAALLQELGYRLNQIDEEGHERPLEAFDLDTPSAYVGRDYVAHPA